MVNRFGAQLRKTLQRLLFRRKKHVDWYAIQTEMIRFSDGVESSYVYDEVLTYREKNGII